MSLKDELLPLVDNLRRIPGELGFRTYQVWVRTTTWSGTRVGVGTSSTTEKRLLVGGLDPKVRVIRTKDLVAGAVELADAEYEIGPLTPTFSGGGVSEDDINPQNTGIPTEVFFLIKGPGCPAEGLLARRMSHVVDHPLRITVKVKGIGRKRPT